MTTVHTKRDWRALWLLLRKCGNGVIETLWKMLGVARGYRVHAPKTLWRWSKRKIHQ